MKLQEWGDTEWVYPHTANFGPEGEWQAHGMTLRDYFAAKAVNGFCSDPNWRADPSEYAEKAYLIADAMLAAREAK